MPVPAWPTACPAPATASTTCPVSAAHWPPRSPGRPTRRGRWPAPGTNSSRWCTTWRSPWRSWSWWYRCPSSPSCGCRCGCAGCGGPRWPAGYVWTFPERIFSLCGPWPRSRCAASRRSTRGSPRHGGAAIRRPSSRWPPWSYAASGCGPDSGRALDPATDVGDLGRARLPVGHPLTGLRRRDHALLQERVTPGGHPLGGGRVDVVGVVPQLGEQRLGALPGLAGEQVGEFQALGPGLALGLRLGACGRDREQLRADVDKPGQERLLALHLALPARHGVERLARELARRALDVAQVPGEGAERAVRPGRLALARDQGGQPRSEERRVGKEWTAEG